MRGEEWERHIWDEGKTPSERPCFLLVPASPVYSLFQPDQEGNREGAQCGGGGGGEAIDLQMTQQLQ